MWLVEIWISTNHMPAIQMNLLWLPYQDQLFITRLSLISDPQRPGDVILSLRTPNPSGHEHNYQIPTNMTKHAKARRTLGLRGPSHKNHLIYHEQHMLTDGKNISVCSFEESIITWVMKLNQPRLAGYNPAVIMRYHGSRRLRPWCYVQSGCWSVLHGLSTHLVD